MMNITWALIGWGPGLESPQPPSPKLGSADGMEWNWEWIYPYQSSFPLELIRRVTFIEFPLFRFQILQHVFFCLLYTVSSQRVSRLSIKLFRIIFLQSVLSYTVSSPSNYSSQIYFYLHLHHICVDGWKILNCKVYQNFCKWLELILFFSLCFH